MSKAMNKYIKLALIASGYRKHDNYDVWAKPFANALFVYDPDKMELKMGVKSLKGHMITNHSDVFDRGDKVTYQKFLGFICRCESRFRYFPDLGVTAEDRFHFLTTEEVVDLSVEEQ